MKPIISFLFVLLFTGAVSAQYWGDVCYEIKRASDGYPVHNVNVTVYDAFGEKLVTPSGEVDYLIALSSGFGYAITNQFSYIFPDQNGVIATFQKDGWTFEPAAAYIVQTDVYLGLYDSVYGECFPVAATWGN